MWNYRIMSRQYPESVGGQTLYGIYEVFYNRKKEIVAWDTEPSYGPCETVDELIAGLNMMLKDAERCKNDILLYEMKAEGDWDS